MKAPKKNFNLKKENVCSIVITFKTNTKTFKNILRLHNENFTHTIIVNNTREINLSNFQSNQVTLINNPSNLGLASALNIGILEAKKYGFDMVALFDQDTLLPEDFSQKMLNNINSLQIDEKIALFSPIYFNQVTKLYGSIINFKLFRLIRTKPNPGVITNPQYVITSGSFIPISVLDDIGMMLDDLFIDFVDIEWCLRAYASGYKIISYPKIVISHNLGDSCLTIFGLSYPIHSPLRMYYYFRNALFLYRSKNIDWNWRLIDASRNLFRFLFYMIFVEDRKTYFRYIIMGYYHGLIKKMGKLKE